MVVYKTLAFSHLVKYEAISFAINLSYEHNTSYTRPYTPRGVARNKLLYMHMLVTPVNKCNIYTSCAGKALVVCQTALKGFKDIVAVTAGPKERKRAENLLNFVTIVDDQPSPRASSLKSQGRVKERSKVSFDKKAVGF